MAAPIPNSAGDRAAIMLRSKRGNQRLIEQFIQGGTFSATLVSALTTIGIVVVLLLNSLPFFQQVSIGEFLTGREWQPAGGKFGILPLVSSTLLITLGSAFISIPLGLMVGIFLAEYAPRKVRNVVKPALELLAGVPTVVYGYFALTVVTPFLRGIFPSIAPLNLLAGAIVVGIMTLPLVSSLCEDAISSVPRALPDGAVAMGATKFESIKDVVIPAALSGIVASFILAISRAVGEVMAVAMAAGLMPNLTANFLDGGMTMTAYIVNTSKGDLPRGGIDYFTVFAVGLTLFFITLGLNLLANKFVRKYRQVYS